MQSVRCSKASTGSRSGAGPPASGAHQPANAALLAAVRRHRRHKALHHSRQPRRRHARVAVCIHTHTQRHYVCISAHRVRGGRVSPVAVQWRSILAQAYSTASHAEQHRAHTQHTHRQHTHSPGKHSPAYAGHVPRTAQLAPVPSSSATAAAAPPALPRAPPPAEPLPGVRRDASPPAGPAPEERCSGTNRRGETG